MAGRHRVAIVVESAPTVPYWHEAVAELRARGHDVAVVSLSSAGPLLDAAAGDGATVTALGLRGVLDYPRTTRRLTSFLRAWSPDVVQGVGPIPTAVGGIAGLLAGVKVRLYHRHHVEAQEPWPLPFLARAAATDVMAVSQSAGRAATGERWPHRPVTVAMNGVAAVRTVTEDEVGAVRADLGIGRDALVVTQVSRLNPGKGQDLLIAASGAAAARLGRPVEVVLVGEGPARPAIEEAVRGADVRVHLVGHHDDVALWYAAADVVALPSSGESFGLVVAEAMASGRPVVASRVGGIPEVVAEGVSGILVPPGDVERLADALIAVLADPDTAQRMGAEGRRIVAERFTVAAMVDRWLDSYDRALSARRRAR